VGFVQLHDTVSVGGTGSGTVSKIDATRSAVSSGTLQHYSVASSTTTLDHTWEECNGASGRAQPFMPWFGTMQGVSEKIWLSGWRRGTMQRGQRARRVYSTMMWDDAPTSASNPALLVTMTRNDCNEVSWHAGSFVPYRWAMQTDQRRGLRTTWPYMYKESSRRCHGSGRYIWKPSIFETRKWIFAEIRWSMAIWSSSY